MTGEELGRFVENMVIIIGSVLLLPIYVVAGLLKMDSKNGKIL